MDAEEIKRIEDKCKIKSKEQFIQEYEWQQSGENLRIDKIVIKTTESTSGLTNELGLEFPLVAITTTSDGKEPDQRLIDNGWIPERYIYYDGLFYYHKVVDIRTIVDKIEISFTKKTEERDKREFGFVDEFTFGAYSYPIPSTLLEDISICAFENVKKSNSEYVGKYYVPAELRQKIMDSVAKNIIDDEFNALLNLRDEHKQGLFGNIDVKITREEQENNWAEVSWSIIFKNLANLNVYGSRSSTVTDYNFDLVHQEYVRQLSNKKK